MEPLHSGVRDTPAPRDRFDIAKGVDGHLRMRTWHYVQKPAEYDIQCDKCHGSNLWWSEYEGKIWCYDCLLDVDGTEGVFGGPIPIELAGVLGMSFDRWDMVNKQVLVWDKKANDYVPQITDRKSDVTKETP